jgi:hypothetical protein
MRRTITRSIALIAKIGSVLTASVTTALIVCICPSAIAGGYANTEAARVIAHLLAMPVIKVAPGFKAKIIVPPDQIYDPLQMVPHGDELWVNDDGGESEKGGGRLVSVDAQGNVSVLISPDQMLPDVGMDVAPEGFGDYSGQLFLLTQPDKGEKGLWANHLIQRVNPQTKALRQFCTLPRAGSAGHGIAGAGSALWFGPPHSPFAGRIFAVTTQNDMVYQATPEGKCSPFADFARYGVPLELTFTPDHQTMLVSVTPTNAEGEPDASAQRGMIMKVSPHGEIDPKPLIWGLRTPGGMAFAPSDFKWYGGQLFFTDVGDFQAPVPMTQPLKADGVVMRLGKGGIPKLVASGFVNPLHLRFIGKKLWVSDINGDFIDGKRELPDGFIVQITTLPTL